MQEGKAPQRQVLEACFKKLPEAPRGVVVKESVLRDGVAFTGSVLRAGEGRVTKTYQLQGDTRRPYER
ncbi:MAG: hypothetical protein Q8O76_14360 [Chloroflexota bacterium]|nr:hypothetical protein [Chloroflexota bacterium]